MRSVILYVLNKDAELAADAYLSRKEAALFLRRLGCSVSHDTLRRWSLNDNAGRGPSFLKTRDRGIRYAQSDLEKWAVANMRRIE